MLPDYHSWEAYHVFSLPVDCFVSYISLVFWVHSWFPAYTRPCHSLLRMHTSHIPEPVGSQSIWWTPCKALGTWTWDLESLCHIYHPDIVVRCNLGPYTETHKWQYSFIKALCELWICDHFGSFYHRKSSFCPGIEKNKIQNNINKLSEHLRSVGLSTRVLIFSTLKLAKCHMYK